jgi:uncharacterized protein YbjQ (UPF0145 family)
MKNKPIFVVTTDFIPGYRVKEVCGLVWASSVRAKFFLQDLRALTRIFLGGEVVEYWELLNEGRHHILSQIDQNAKKLDADAVISFKLAGARVINGAVEIMGYGTAVKLEKE